MKSLWEAMNDSKIHARWVKVECQPQIMNPETQELVKLAEDPEKTGQLILTVDMDGVPTRTLFDPGASHSFVDTEWARRHQKKMVDLPRPMTLSMFQEGNTGTVAQICRIQHTCVGPIDVPWVFCAIDNAATEAVFGLDFIREHQLLYDPAHDGIYVGRKRRHQKPMLTSTPIRACMTRVEEDPPTIRPDPSENELVYTYYHVDSEDWAQGSNLGNRFVTVDYGTLV